MEHNYEDDVPIKSIKLAQLNLTLAGYSRAASATYFYVPELKIQLDMGGYSKSYKATKFFVTHSHLDHAMYMPDVQPAFVPEGTVPNQVFVPNNMTDYVISYLHSAQELNNNMNIAPSDEKTYDLVPVAEGDTHQLNKNYHVEVFAVCHTVPAVGYGFYELRNKLKPEYQGLPGREIGQLRKQGVAINTLLKVHKFVFLGDTTIQVFEQSPAILEYPVIIIECTFLDPDHEAMAKGAGHVHWQHLEPYVVDHPDTTFILIHFSLRYKNKEIVEFFIDKPGNAIPWVSYVK
eukprot:TRINITY_DN1704_c0_g1_i2.p1 TRINITY_DN1704_c0_g1~~TRINITY_DN1704_c0_g1_i2.p1  ORF type:complete len:290 (-),score=51.49 TRINITY_DN1704_c0_g1_i2:407-1276(-)